MPVQQIELEEVAIIEVSDVALEQCCVGALTLTAYSCYAWEGGACGTAAC